MGKIIAIANQKGGVGKTTTAINLGACLAECNKRVIVVDIDPQGNATSGLGIGRNSVDSGVYGVILDGAPIESVIRGTVVQGLWVLPSTPDLAGAEIELVSMDGREMRLKNALECVRDRYDYILIDCPPSLGLLTINGLTAADSVLVPIQCEYYALEGLGQLMSSVRLVQQRLNAGLILEGVLLTMFDGRTNLSIQVADEVKKYFRDKVFGVIIPRNVRLGEAPSHGMPINLYDERSKGAEVYRELAKEVIERVEGNEKKPRSWIGRLNPRSRHWR